LATCSPSCQASERRSADHNGGARVPVTRGNDMESGNGVDKKSFDLETWEDFETTLAQLRIKYPAPDSHTPMLFRGQSDERWKLETTLRRRSSRQVTWKDYAYLVRATMPAVQSLTGKDWPEPSHEVLFNWGNDYDQGRGPPPGYDYYVYLRHHGFPSPLLDWSRSVYVAAFFAFRNAAKGRVAIYAYLDNIGRGKVGGSDRPVILHLGPYVNSHPRHVLQQCEYTLCSRWDADHWVYASHHDVFEFGERDQDLLWKFSLPASERLKVLRRLDESNLNAYSLFPTEDALLETVALREIDFRRGGWT
jgi:FRG domain-containing protein